MPDPSSHHSRLLSEELPYVDGVCRDQEVSLRYMGTGDSRRQTQTTETLGATRTRKSSVVQYQ
jgi:hypothetical protein